MDNFSKEQYQSAIAELSDDSNIIALFSEIPYMDEKTYNQTAYFDATKQYEKYIEQGNGIPQGFYTILEDSIAQVGILKTCKQYKDQIDIICEISSITTKELISLFKHIDNKNDQGTNSQKTKARATLRELIRKTISIHKENYIKERLEEKKDLYNKRLKKVPKKDDSNKLYIKEFIEKITNHQSYIEGFQKQIETRLGISITTDQAKEILRLSFEKNPVEKIADLLGINEEAESFGKYAQRLTDKFQPIINANPSILLNDTKKAQVIEYLNFLVKLKKGNIEPQESQLLSSYRLWFTKDELELFEQIAVFMTKCNAKVSLKNNKIVFVYDKRIIEQYKNNLKTSKKKKIIKSIQRQIYSAFLKELKVIENLTNQSSNANQHTNIEYVYVIDESKWLDPNLIEQLINNIDISTLNEKEYIELYSLLNEKGLLWAYISGNISLDTMTIIINNFKSIYATIENEKINLDNIEILIRQANLFDYADNISLAIYGPEILSKIINYNQFSGVAVTKDTIKRRIRQAIDIAKRSENSPSTSLPYDLDCHVGSYTLSRYKNNDPEAVVCGVETKTCFFISVNDNDFFFYTLLNKNGMILKIKDESGKLIARAACFKNNNALFINGIRLYNNQVLPENKDDIDKFKNIMKLFEIMSKKLIESTTSDTCPIDYVICNKAGLLENEMFDYTYEKIDPRILYNPLDTNHPDWEEFVHMYDNEEEQLLQQVPYNSNGFQTDYGNNYPPILIYSRKHMGITSPRDIKFIDQDPIYERPRSQVRQFIKEEIDEQVIRKINRIRALSVLNNTPKPELKDAKERFTLLKDAEEIKNLIIGEDWFIALKEDETYVFVSTNYNKYALAEAKVFMNKINKVAKLIK